MFKKLLDKYKAWKKRRQRNKRLKELRKKDPFIYE